MPANVRPHLIVFLSAYLFFSLLLSAQDKTNAAPSRPDCDHRIALKKVAWGKISHPWLASVFHDEKIDLNDTWCRIWETKGYDRLHKTEDFGRALFTGDGLHPSVGTIVPGSGLAGGLQLNLERAVSKPPIRYSGTAESRGSINGFWIAGGKFDMLGSGNTADDRHIDFTLSVTHSSLPQLTYFGLGGFSALANESVYGLQETNPKAVLAVPLPKGFTVSPMIGGLLAHQEGSRTSQHPSIDQVFNATNTPGLNSATTYFISGLQVAWQYPAEERLHGYRTSLAGSFHDYHETTAAPFSFRRAEAVWAQAYNPSTTIDLGTVSLVGRLVESVAPAGNVVPFYLQPTIGGTDINNQDVVRSYRDYRFRAPNILAFQTEYEHSIYDPLGLLLFYDVGKVTLQRSDLDISNMRHSYGIGAVIRVGGAPVFKIYYALGGREGSHTSYTGNTNNFAGTGAHTSIF